MPKSKSRGVHGGGRLLVVALVVGAAVVVSSLYLVFDQGNAGAQQKPVILYVNQGNGIVNGTRFGTMLSFMASHNFTMVFFQVYRSGHLLFSPQTLQGFVNETHRAKLKIFFALYITGDSQVLPTSIFGLHQDGVSLDMSALAVSAQKAFLSQLSSYHPGETAVTTTNMTSTLKPDLLVLETYGAAFRGDIHGGIVASVGVFATTSESDYRSQFQYALQNSDGVMVFDYYGLVKSGY